MGFFNKKGSRFVLAWVDRLSFRLILPAGILLLWHLSATAGIANPLLLPSLADTMTALLSLGNSSDFFNDVQSTAYRFFYGYITAVVVGVPAGLLIGSFSKVHRFFEFFLEFGRSIPVTAFFPLFLLLFGIQDLSKIAMVIAATIFIVILNSAYGARYANHLRKKVAISFGASRWQTFWYITIWDALPQIVVGMRTALSLALIVVIVSEMVIGTEVGLGQRIYDAYTYSRTPELYALLIIIGTIGFVFNKGFYVLEQRVVHWTGR